MMQIFDLIQVDKNDYDLMLLLEIFVSAEASRRNVPIVFAVWKIYI